MENVNNFPDIHCWKIKKMRIAKRDTANETTSEISGEMCFNLSSFAKLCSLRVILLKCGAYTVLCTSPVVWKNVSQWPPHQEIKCIKKKEGKRKKNLHMECLFFISELLVGNSDAIKF